LSESIDLFEIMFNCRAMRRIRPDPVPEELIVELVRCANQAPTASNRQGGRWLVVRDAGIRKQLADINRAARAAAYGAAPAAVPADPRMARRQRASRWHVEHLHEVPVHFIACLEFNGPLPDSWYAHMNAGGSIWPAVQNLLLACRARGLGAVPTTLPLRDRAAAKAALGLPANVEPYCHIPVGYPMGRFGPVTRRPVQEILHWDRW
jgi:nitroreductase